MDVLLESPANRNQCTNHDFSWCIF